MSKSVIVIIGYNRLNSLKACYQAAVRAVYPDEDTVDLIFSLDHSDQEDAIEQAIRTFAWPYGELKVLKHPERLGLRKHVVSCGTLVEDYEFLVMLEDDIIVSDSFYLYTKKAAEFYGNDRRIGGISLYSPHLYPQNGRNFQPEFNGSDTYMMQVAQSWGQAWTKSMWEGFYSWYNANQTFEQPASMPDYAYSWDQRSWLRYFMGYVCSENKYLIYPYHSYSTNMEDVGENRKLVDTDYQVALTSGQREFRFLPFDKCVRYNGYYEREEDSLFAYRFNGEPAALDLNGTRNRYGNERYIASTVSRPFECVASYGLKMRPQEVNLKYEVSGDEIRIYDRMKPAKAEPVHNMEQVVRYDARAISWKRLLYLGANVAVEENLEHLKKKWKKRRSK